MRVQTGEQLVRFLSRQRLVWPFEWVSHFFVFHLTGTALGMRILAAVASRLLSGAWRSTTGGKFAASRAPAAGRPAACSQEVRSLTHS